VRRVGAYAAARRLGEKNALDRHAQVVAFAFAIHIVAGPTGSASPLISTP